MSSYERTEGIVLKHTDYRESSQIGWFLTPSFGKLRVLAKGSRRQGKRAAGALDTLTRCEVVVLRRTRSDLHLLVEWHAKERFPGLRSRLDCLHAGLYAAEVVLKTVEESEDHPDLYQFLVEALTRLSLGDDRDLALFRFELALLRELGFGPRTDACVRCDRRPEQRCGFSAAAGGALCADCARDTPASVALSAGTLATMARLSQGRLKRLSVSPRMRPEIRGALDDCVATVTGRPLRMAQYIQISSQAEARAS